MANEARIIELHGNMGDAVRYTCADNVGIEKGTILWYDDPRTVSGASVAPTQYKQIAGIASEEKVANDGQTSIGCFTSGIFDLTSVASPAILAGDFVVLSGQNLITRAGDMVTVSGSAIIGKALETSGASEVIAVKVRL